MRLLAAVLVAVSLVVIPAQARTADASAPSAAPSAQGDPLTDAVAASSAPGSHWTPEPERYGVVTQKDVPVKMADGTVLRATIDSPADAGGQPAKGPFPVLLTQSPYGKDTAGMAQNSGIGVDPYFVKRGYIDVAVDVRGTGSSQGSFTLFAPQQVKDGVALVKWAAALPHSDGKVGLHGASYLGINQLLVAGAIGRHSPLKAIFPVISGNELYRDTAFMGGMPDAEFDVAYLGGLLPVVDLVNPVVGMLTDPAALADDTKALLQHGQNTLDYNAGWLLKTFMGGPESYDTHYWTVRSPSSALARVAANHVPAYLIGGEYDIFQRGEPLNYAGLQNAWAGRPVGAPMRAGQRVTGRYQLIDGPYTHLGAALSGSVLEELQLRWFDTWLKDEHTGMAHTSTPLHYYDSGTGRYAETTTYPLTGATPTTYYLGGDRSGTAASDNDGSLGTTPPTATSGADTVSWAPVGSALCDRSIDQWMMGAASLVTSQLPAPTPCLDDDRAGQTGPTALTYTTAPLATARTLAGPISARLYASATTKDTEWVVNVEDVAPDGTSRPLTEGALLGSDRAVDAARSWRVDGKTVLPYHPYTKAAQRPVVPGRVTRYDVEVFPTYSTIAAGHRIRVTISTTDFPHISPTPGELADLAGGVYQLQRTAGDPSSITLPLE